MTEPNDLLTRIGRAAEAIDPAFTERDVQRLIAGAGRRARRRTLRRVALGGLGLGAAAIVLALRFHSVSGVGGAPAETAVASAPLAAAPGSAVETAPEPLRFDDGSVATPLGAGSALAVREVSPQQVIVALARGRGRFEVTPRPERQFVVQAGDVTVTVLGTAFTVERVADRIGVTVERGKVMVDWGLGARRLVAGDSGWFPPLVVGRAAAPAPAAPAPAAAPRPRPAERATALAVSASARDRRSRGERDTRDESAPSLEPPELPPLVEKPAPPARPASAPIAASPRASSDDGRRPAVRESAAALLAAADAARLDGRPADGAALLRRVLRDHRDDPRAPLAAFTLGRVLLKELDRPREAAAAFAAARSLAPRGPFAEDALAREVEAWSAAGETGEAEARAQAYLRRYPNGRRAAAMRAVGGE